MLVHSSVDFRDAGWPRTGRTRYEANSDAWRDLVAGIVILVCVAGLLAARDERGW